MTWRKEGMDRVGALERAGEQDAETIWKMQVGAFAELLKKYHDYDTNPGAESLERVRAKLVRRTHSSISYL